MYCNIDFVKNKQINKQNYKEKQKHQTTKPPNKQTKPKNSSTNKPKPKFFFSFKYLESHDIVYLEWKQKCSTFHLTTCRNLSDKF